MIQPYTLVSCLLRTESLYLRYVNFRVYGETCTRLERERPWLVAWVYASDLSFMVLGLLLLNVWCGGSPSAVDRMGIGFLPLPLEAVGYCTQTLLCIMYRIKEQFLGVRRSVWYPCDRCLATALCANGIVRIATTTDPWRRVTLLGGFVGVACFSQETRTLRAWADATSRAAKTSVTNGADASRAPHVAYLRELLTMHAMFHWCIVLSVFTSVFILDLGQTGAELAYLPAWWSSGLSFAALWPACRAAMLAMN